MFLIHKTLEANSKSESNSAKILNHVTTIWQTVLSWLCVKLFKSLLRSMRDNKQLAMNFSLGKLIQHQTTTAVRTDNHSRKSTKKATEYNFHQAEGS